MRFMNKKPNDYPLFGFRVLPKVKQTVMKEFEEVFRIKKKKALRSYKKNELFIDALRAGLQELKKQEEVKK